MRMRHVIGSLGLAACGNAAGAPPHETRRPDPVRSSPAGLVINEVAAAGAPDDWFEVINTGATAVELADFAFVDTAGALDRGRRFPDFTLAPGERHVQYVSGAVAGFQLGADEALWLYRTRDGAIADAVDWPAGASPDGGSYARVPDATGAFTTVGTDTQGEPNTAPDG